LKTISQSLTTTIADLDDIISAKSKSIGNQHNERVNLHLCTNKIIESLEIDSTYKRVTIYNTLTMDDALWANRSFFESVIYNLITDGIKYSNTNKNSQIIIQSLYSRDTIKNSNYRRWHLYITKYMNQLFQMYQTFNKKRRTSEVLAFILKKIKLKSSMVKLN
tara:strand:+ start:172 stop:660 length:489 start_codon:yes stop_codon:yes gene_type:complete